jgi:hypothetical protein
VLTSGCVTRARSRYACLISAAVASAGTPSTP